MIYVSHPYGGRDDNKYKVEQIILELCDKYPDFTYVSPIHCFGYMYENFDYDTGMAMCLDLLSMCDAMYVYGEYQESQGCMTEIATAKEMCIPVFYPEQDEYLTICPDWERKEY